MSEHNKDKKPLYGRTIPHQAGAKAFGRPASGDKRPNDERRHYGRPVPSTPHAQGERKQFGRPASTAPRAEGEQKQFTRPAPAAPLAQGDRKPYAPRPAFGGPRAQGERKQYGRPAPTAPRADGEQKQFTRPAPAAPLAQGDRKPYAPRPAFGGPRAQGERKQYGRPAPTAPRADGEQKQFARPAPAAPRAEGDRKPYAPRPAFGGPRAQGDRKPYTPRPAFGGPRTQGEHKTYSRPSFGKPGFPRHVDIKPAFIKPAVPRPAAPSLSSDARKSALQVLNRVLLDEGFASLSLNEHFNMVYLSPRDKRLCTNIVYLTLENLSKLDFALDRLLEEPLQLEARVRNLLRLSACQILLLDRVPDSAVVNEAVKITRDLGLEGLTGLVNGVLRNLIRQMEEIPWPKPEDGVQYYSIMYSYPRWLVEQILKDYGQETGHQILTYRRPSQSITIRPNLNRISEEAFLQMLEKKVWKHEKGQMPQAWHVMGVADIGKDSDYLDGNFSIQGEGSMVAAEAAFLKLGAQVLDVCAAPGGKSAYLAERMQGTGRIHAWDVHEHRVELINALIERLRLYNIRPAWRDALVYREQQEGMMDVVLIDAPCTGSGVMDEKPDLKVRLNDQDLQSLLETQRKMLDTCSRYVKPGGLLVYATCSILPDENARQTEAFLLTHPEFSIQALPETIPQSLRQYEGPLGLQLLPYRDSTEGFYIARMRRA